MVKCHQLWNLGYDLSFNFSLNFKYFFIFFNIIYFNLRLITLQYCIGFDIHQHESATGIHTHPEPPSLFPPHTIPLGHPSAPAKVKEKTSTVKNSPLENNKIVSQGNQLNTVAC